MCGICGRLTWDNTPDEEIVACMNARLSHRGPDAEGVVRVGPITLGHRRLAVIDLSPTGQQPMSDITGEYWIAYNGEIYNFPELRHELEGQGARFRSRTDTEVIIEAYKQWGEDCLRRFNGMFALALWDGPKQRLLLGRDRLGKKPLFYQLLESGGIVFASELKALCEAPEVSRRINYSALGHFLSLNYTLTSEAIFQDVRKLPAAHFMLIEHDRPPRMASYWNLSDCFRNKRHFKVEDAAEELRALIDDAVRCRMISDVPLGIFLSGGVDSATIVASACRYAAPASVNTFSMGFHEKSYCELDGARATAGHFGVNHRESFALSDSTDLLGRIVYCADEPFADTSIIPMYLLAQFCRQYVTVCLSGDGGDEIFAGYETYAADRIHHWTRWIPARVSQALYRGVRGVLPVSHDKVSLDYKLRRFLEGHALDAQQAHFHWRIIFTEDEKRRLLKREAYAGPEADPYREFTLFYNDVSDCHYLDQSMYVDIKTWLVDDILVKVDRATMAHALEARAPLLDYRIVEFAASLPVGFKMKGFEKKYLLRKSQVGRVPREVLNRKKRGFNAPVSHWLLEARAFRHLITSTDARIAEVMNVSYIERLWDEHQRKAGDHSLKLLALINLELWCRSYQVIF